MKTWAQETYSWESLQELVKGPTSLNNVKWSIDLHYEPKGKLKILLNESCSHYFWFEFPKSDLGYIYCSDQIIWNFSLIYQPLVNVQYILTYKKLDFARDSAGV